MKVMHVVGNYEVVEVPIEQWLLAALRLQHGLSLPAHRCRRVGRPTRSSPRPKTRAGLWLLLGISCLGLCLL